MPPAKRCTSHVKASKQKFIRDIISGIHYCSRSSADLPALVISTSQSTGQREVPEPTCSCAMRRKGHANIRLIPLVIPWVATVLHRAYNVWHVSGACIHMFPVDLRTVCARCRLGSRATAHAPRFNQDLGNRKHTERGAYFTAVVFFFRVDIKGPVWCVVCGVCVSSTLGRAF